MSEKFPKCKELGLSLHALAYMGSIPCGAEYVRAADVEKLLSEGVEVRGFKNEFGWQLSYDNRDSRDTHFGLFINPKPITKPDTAESLLKEFINMHDGGWYERETSLMERAKRLTGGGK